MTDLATLYFSFWSTAIPFGNSHLPVFLEQLVPVGQSLPYLTYTLSRNEAFENGLDVVRVWTRSTSVAPLMALLDHVEVAMPHGGRTLTLPNGKGAIRLFRGQPFIQRQPMPDGEADIQVGYVNIETRSWML